jgi:RNA polymerase sigma factor (sigma-70 family)
MPVAAPWRPVRLQPDEQLVALIRAGNEAAFEAVYDRHFGGILSFCWHALGSREEAEDAAQHTFTAAYNDMRRSDKPIQLRPWLYTIARNRCLTVMRTCREDPVADLVVPVTEGLNALVQNRQELRDLVADLARLPEQQREALVLAELSALDHEQIADVLGIPRDKVKALVFQARESLVASRAARDTDCQAIRSQLAAGGPGARRQTTIRWHLRKCPGCREFQVRASVSSGKPRSHAAGSRSAGYAVARID